MILSGATPKKNSNKTCHVECSFKSRFFLCIWNRNMIRTSKNENLVHSDSAMIIQILSCVALYTRSIHETVRLFRSLGSYFRCNPFVECRHIVWGSFVVVRIYIFCSKQKTFFFSPSSIQSKNVESTKQPRQRRIKKEERSAPKNENQTGSLNLTVQT